MAITLTERAASHVNSFLAKRGKGVGLRLGVRTSGCSGLAYRIEYADAVNPDDQTFESHGITPTSGMSAAAGNRSTFDFRRSRGSGSPASFERHWIPHPLSRVLKARE